MAPHTAERASALVTAQAAHDWGLAGAPFWCAPSLRSPVGIAPRGARSRGRPTVSRREQTRTGRGKGKDNHG